MQLYAYDQDTLTIAALAIKQKNYTCPECGGVLRLRSGSHRQPHFYHQNKKTRCKLSQKTALHLTIQLQIRKQLLPNNVVLEKRFDQINRIADVYDPARSLVFEVQCSPISLAEVKSRIADYRSIGLRVVWILHDFRFNRRRLSAAEHFLREGPAYFTNMTLQGTGMIYDQFEVFYQAQRVHKGAPVKIDLAQCKELLHPIDRKFPQFFTRKGFPHLYFEKDLTDRLISSAKQEELIETLKKIEQRWNGAIRKTNRFFLLIRRAWRSLFAVLIERV